MSIVDDWREKHVRKPGRGRLVLYIFLLIMVIFMILKADSFVQGFSRIFFSSDTTAVEDGGE